jgi:nitrate/nitrite transport system substrate-binding protein
MRRWGQIPEPKSDQWFVDAAKSVYLPDVYMQAAKLIIDDGHAKAEDFPAGSDGFKEPTPAADVIDGIPFDGRKPNAYLESLSIGLKGTQRLSGTDVVSN